MAMVVWLGSTSARFGPVSPRIPSTGTVMNRALVGQSPLAWCSQVHHYGFSSRRPGFESRREHSDTPSVPTALTSFHGGRVTKRQREG